jgi:hypothetical protein
VCGVLLRNASKQPRRDLIQVAAEMPRDHRKPPAQNLAGHPSSGIPCPASSVCARLLVVAALTEEVVRLIGDLRDEDSDWLIRELRKRTEQRSVPLTTVLSRENPVPHEHSPAVPPSAPGALLRWPQLGPAAVGAAVLLGWAVGIAAGPLAAIIGAVLGLVLGDHLDQHTAAAADA